MLMRRVRLSNSLTTLENSKDIARLTSFSQRKIQMLMLNSGDFLVESQPRLTTHFQTLKIPMTRTRNTLSSRSLMKPVKFRLLKLKRDH
jgi:hypothetical protein